MSDLCQCYTCNAILDASEMRDHAARCPGCVLSGCGATRYEVIMTAASTDDEVASE